MHRTEIFHRHGLAERMAGYLMSEEGASGLFITGPRRTGKSTFIREDLIPYLSATYETQVVYVDLWEDRSANPGDVIIAAIRMALLQFETFLVRAAKGMGVTKVKVANLELELDRIGFGRGETLTKAFAVLAAVSNRSITLIIDEAQHSQVTEDGRQALYAVKAARDALNASSGPGFRLLATGSSSDKLASLVEDKDQAFYQAPLVPLPPLGRDYLAWFRERQPFEPKPSLEAMVTAFEMCDHRPEPLRAIFRELALTLTFDESNVDDVFRAAVDRALTRSKENFFHHVNGLHPLDAAVLSVMARDGRSFAPYTKGSFLDYKTFVMLATGSAPADLSHSAVQQSLERLRSEKFIWRAGRGAYFIEDAQQAAWLNQEAKLNAERFGSIRSQLEVEDGR